MAVATFRSSRFLSWRLFSWTRLFLPDVLKIQDDRLVIRRRKWMGLKSTEEELRFDRIASLRVKKGFFTGRIVIETNGSLQEITLCNLWKRKANKAAKAIRAKL